MGRPAVGESDWSTIFGGGVAWSLDDEELLARYRRSGDESAFSALMARHGRTVWAVCREVLSHREDAEDAFQATFLQLARRSGSIRDASALGGWLRRTAERTALRIRRRESARGRREAEAIRVRADLDGTSLGAGVTEDERAARIARVHAAIARLPRPLADVVIGCDLEGRSYAELADDLGVPASTVRGRLARARARLRRLGHAEGPSGSPRSSISVVPPFLADSLSTLTWRNPLMSLSHALVQGWRWSLSVALTFGLGWALATVGQSDPQPQRESTSKIVAPEIVDGRSDSRAVDDGPGGFAIAWTAEPDLDVGDYHINALTLSEDGSTLAVAMNSAVVEVWDRAARRLVARLESEGGVATASFSPNGRLLVTGDYADRGRIWDLRDPAEPIVLEHPGMVTASAFAGSGDLIATGSQKPGGRGVVRLWTPEGDLIADLDGHESLVTALAFSPDGSRLASAESGPRVILRTARWAAVESTFLQPEGYEVTSLAFSPDGRLLVIGAQRPWPFPTGAQGRIEVIEVATGRVVRTFEELDLGVRHVAFRDRGPGDSGSGDLPAGPILIASQSDQGMRQIVAMLRSRGSLVGPPPEYRDGRIRAWSLDDDRVLWSLPAPRGVDDFALTPDGRDLLLIQGGLSDTPEDGDRVEHVRIYSRRGDRSTPAP